MKKTILTPILTGILLGGILAEPGVVQAKEVRLTFNCESAGEEEKAVIEKLLPEYAGETETFIELVSGEADICMGEFDGITEMYRKGKLVNLYPYMEKESPYSEADSWGEALPEEIGDRLQVYKREIPGYPASRDVVRMFCNKDLFEKAGIEIPVTWSELMKSCKEFQEKEITPLMFPAKDEKSPVWQWLVNYLCSQMEGNLADSLDETEDRYVELAEACKGADKGELDYTQPQIKAAFQCLKDLYDFSAGNDLNYEEALEAFTQGETAMLFASGEDAKKLKGKFFCKAVAFPAVTEETSEYASGQKLMAGGGGTDFYGISSALTDQKERLEAAVDFVQYMTSEKVQEKMASEAGSLPSAKDAELPDFLQDFRVAEEPLRMAYFTGLDEKNQEEIWGYTREYLDEKVDIAALTEQLNQSCQEAAGRVREEKGWTLVNNYGMPTSGECTKCAP